MKKALLVFFMVLLTGCIRLVSSDAPSSELPVATRLALSGRPSPLPAAVPTIATPSPIPTMHPPTRTAVPSPSPTHPVLLIPSAPPLLRSSAPHLPLYNLQVELDVPGHQAAVQQTITQTNGTADTWEELVFHVANAYWPGIFNLHTLAVNNQPITPTLEVTMLHLPLPEPLLPGMTAVTQFSYTLNLPPVNPVGWGPTGNAGWTQELVQMGDWYPALVPYQEGQGWQTWLYTAVGDPVISPLADYNVTIHAPPEVTIAALGLQMGDGRSSDYHLPNARAFAFLASPEYVVIEGQANGIPVTLYLTEAHKAAGGVVMETAVRALQLFSERYGPYPYPELVIAENGFLTAMEYSGLVSLSGFALDNYNNTPESLLIALIAHEVAHQWWYGGVGNDQVQEGWLDESLAMLSEWLYYEQFYPESVPWWWQFRVEQWNPAGPVNATVYDYPNSETYVHDVYGRAAYFIRDLREMMGEEVFRAFLGDYYGRYQHQFANGEDFFSLAQSYTDADLTTLKQLYFEKTRNEK